MSVNWHWHNQKQRQWTERSRLNIEPEMHVPLAECGPNEAEIITKSHNRKTWWTNNYTYKSVFTVLNLSAYVFYRIILF